MFSRFNLFTNRNKGPIDKNVGSISPVTKKLVYMLNLQEIENLLKDKIYNLVTEKYNKEYDAHLFQTSSHTYRYR